MSQQQELDQASKKECIQLARVALTQAGAQVFDALKHLSRANGRRFEQTAFRKDLQSVEKKLSKLAYQIQDLDL